MHFRVNGNELLVELSGKIYAEEATALREEVLEYLDRSYTSVVLDRKNVNFIDSSG